MGFVFNLGYFLDISPNTLPKYECSGGTVHTGKILQPIRKMPKKIIYYIISFVFILVVTGCEEPVEPITKTVDPTFREFYESLGGEQILGPAISIMYEEKRQKTSIYDWCFDDV